MNQAMKNLKQGKKTLRLEVTMSIGEHFLPEWLVHFTDRYPQYRVESRLAYGRIIESHLATGQTDLAVLESAPDHPDILVQQWREDDLVLVCGPNHPLASESSISKSDLRELTFVLREKNAAIRELLDKRFEEHQLYNLDVVMEVGSTDAITDILYRNRHVSFLPRFAIAEDIKQGRLIPIDVQDFQLKRILWIARNRLSQEHMVANAFIEMLRG
jgi:DNA-binding transcriptional LysR family regulator